MGNSQSADGSNAKQAKQAKPSIDEDHFKPVLQGIKLRADKPQNNTDPWELSVSNLEELSEAQQDILTAPLAGLPQSFPPKSARGFRAASYQWLYPEEELWCEVSEFHFVGCFAHKWWLDADEYPEACIAEVSRKIQITYEAKKYLQATILQKTAISQQEWKGIREVHRAACPTPDDFTDRFKKEFESLGDVYKPLGPPDRESLLLRIHHAHLNMLGDFLSVYSEQYLSRRMRGASKVISLNLFRVSMEALVKDTARANLIAMLGNELLSTTESLLEVVKAKLSDADYHDKLAPVAALIHGCARETKASLSNISVELQQGAQYAAFYRDSHQSGNVRMLTLLATFFLPMSLAASTLSMQTRFADLHELLYDFAGVSVFGVALALLLALLARWFFWSNNQYRKARHALTTMFPDRRQRFVRSLFLSMMISVLTWYSVLLVGLFGLGMFLDVYIAGWMTVGCLFVLIVYSAFPRQFKSMVIGQRKRVESEKAKAAANAASDASPASGGLPTTGTEDPQASASSQPVPDTSEKRIGHQLLCCPGLFGSKRKADATQQTAIEDV